ncbi:hypothetical protein AYL99_04861 [Fonsecaea erecta]|uniref:Uncharacterized protein n=1 Tax=Fonsecaea erecta TaxID=1367422 RepID=A0A178ZJ76_9EURO|nr:hypothetical protein AYL99_04861 [Fonsecaea erecta]OAP59859.1 hypothetical protein AYL99_04861 [Fonsecaea erecta]
MPASLLSDRKMTVNYAIDLLRAHQIRRENVLLHEQLKTCVKELATLREEMQDLKANRLVAVENQIKPIRESIDTTSRAFILVERHEIQLTDQAYVKASYHKIQETQRTQRAIVEEQIGAVRMTCQNRATAQHQQDQQTRASLENLQRALGGKADAAAVNLLEARLNGLASDHGAGPVAGDSISHVSDTVEHRCPQHEPDESVQVQGSQHGKHVRRETFGRPGPHRPREMTVPDDLDLDANAHTISYAGHGGHRSQPNDSLKMLSPSPAQATQLAEIKTLQQRRFDGWDTYYDQGQKLVQDLPHDFEGTIVRNFVDGLFKDSHKKQCRQWLDSSGWTWANVTIFGNLCSQLLADNASREAMETEAAARPKQMGAMLTAGDNSRRNTDGMKSKKGSKYKVQQFGVDAPLRRSQRVVQKKISNAYYTGQPAEDKSRPGPPTHSSEQDIVQGSKHNTKSDNVRAETQIQLQFDQATEPQARLQGSERGGVKGRGTTGMVQSTTIPAELQSHKRNAVAVELGHPAKRLKSHSTARAGDRHDISVPQLVSFRQQKQMSVEESSNDEGFLYKANLSRPSASKTGRRVHKRRGLPLPPPPEIPILPTTDEE